jgi:hypothetical protein
LPGRDAYLDGLLSRFDAEFVNDALRSHAIDAHVTASKRIPSRSAATSEFRRRWCASPGRKLVSNGDLAPIRNHAAD